jgi:hypothetical protein
MILRKRKSDRREDILYAKWQTQASLPKRVPYYRKTKDLYMYGGDPAFVTRSNKIHPSINKQSSFLYAPHTVKFWMDVPPEEESPETYDRLDPAADGLAMAWHDSGLGKIFKRAVTWSLVHGATILSILPRLRSNGSVDIVADYVHPQQFGVWDDTQPEIEKQEAVSLTSFLSLPQIKRLIALHPDRAEIERSLMAGQKQQSGFEGMITTPPNATTFDIKPEFWLWYSREFDYMPVFTQPYYEWTDTYIFDDDLESYRICTTTGDYVIWDRPMDQCCVPGVLPFVKVCAEEHPEWFWGVSLADELSKLQMWYCSLMDMLDTLIGKVAQPPVAVIGVGQTYDEKVSQYRRKKGEMTLPPGADIKSFQPDIPQAFFAFIEGVDSMIDEQAGQRMNTLGKTDKGGAKGGEAMSHLLAVAGSEVLSKAYEIEMCAQEAGALLHAYQRRYSDAHLLDEKGRPFLMADFPPDTRVRVDGHSSSSLFQEDAFQKAMALSRVDAITKEMLLDMANIPQASRAKHDLRKIEFIQSLAEQVVKMQQQQKRTGKEPALKK